MAIDVAGQRGAGSGASDGTECDANGHSRTRRESGAQGMTLRITTLHARRGTTLRVDGNLLGNATLELERAIEAAVDPLVLDLSGVLFADTQGVTILQAIRSRGGRLRNIPPYVAFLLQRSDPGRGKD